MHRGLSFIQWATLQVSCTLVIGRYPGVEMSKICKPAECWNVSHSVHTALENPQALPSQPGQPRVQWSPASWELHS